MAGAVCRTRSGDSALTALPATSRWPTSEGSRTPPSQPAARVAQRSGRACSRQHVVGAGGQPLVAVRAADVEQAGRAASSSSQPGLGLGHVQRAGQPLQVADADAAAAQQTGAAPPRAGRAARRPARPTPARRRRPAGRPPPGRGSRPPGSGRSRGGPVGRVTAQQQPDLARQLHVERVDAGQQPPLQQPPRRGCRAVAGGVGQVARPAGRRPAGPARPRSSGGSSARAARRSPGSVSRSSAAGRPRPAGCRTARRTGSGARSTSSPHSSARSVSVSIGGRDDVVGHVGQLGGQLGRRAGRRWGRAGRRRAPAGSPRRARRARGPPTPGRRAGWPGRRRRRAPGGRRRAAPPAARRAARRCGCAARRRAWRGGRRTSGPRYDVRSGGAARPAR